MGQIAANIETPTNPNPYPGPTPYQYGDDRILAGRDWEGRQLVAQTITDCYVLFYAQSGAGKSSLINKKVIPEFQRRGFKVMRVAHIGRELTKKIDAFKAKNIFVLSLLLNWESEPDVDRLYTMRLVDYINDKSINDDLFYVPVSPETQKEFAEFVTKPLGKILIIDQFEEIVTAHDRYWEQRKDFFDQLGQALINDPTLSVIFVAREDSIAQLERYLYKLPNGLKGRFHMNPLTFDQALQAIQAPARKAGIPFGPGAAEQLALDLSQQRSEGRSQQKPENRKKTGKKDGMSPVRSEFIDPVLLQAVCVQIWENVAPTRPVNISKDHVRMYGSVDEALENLYRTALRRVAEKEHLPRSTIALWFEEKLIDSSRRRAQVAGGLKLSAITALVDEYLVRPVNFGGETTYQLSHDRLIGPVLRVNSRIIPKDIPLRNIARNWDLSGRDESFLLRGHNLQEMERWANDHAGELRTLEKQFLEASRRNEEVRKRDRLRNITLITVVALIVVVFFLIILYRQNRKVNHQNHYLTATQEAIRATYAVDKDPSLALLLAVHAASISYSDHGDLFPEVKSSLDLSVQNSRLNLLISGKFHQPVIALFSPDGGKIAAASDISVVLFDSLTGERLEEFNSSLQKPSHISSLAFTADGESLAFGADDGTALIVDLKTRRSILLRHHTAIASVAFSPSGKEFITAGRNGLIKVWDWKHGAGATPKVLHHSENGSQEADSIDVTSVAYSPNGLYFASAGSDGSVQLWDAKTWDQLAHFRHSPSESINEIAFCPSSSCLLTAGNDSTAKVWEINPATSPELPLLILPHPSHVESIAISPDEQYIATGSGNGKINLWNAKIPELRRRVRARMLLKTNISSLQLPGSSSLSYSDAPVLSGHTRTIRSVTFSPLGNRVLSAGDDSTVRVWNTGSILDAPVHDLAISHDEQLIAIVTSDGIQVKTFDTNEELYRQPLKDGSHVAFSPNGKSLAVSSSNHVMLLNPASGTTSRTSAPMVSCVGRCEAIALSSSMLAVIDAENKVRIWKGDVLQPDAPSEGKYFSAAFDSSGNVLALGAEDKIILWGVDSKQVLESFSCSGCGQIETLYFNPDNNNQLASGSKSGKVNIWDIQTRGVREIKGSDKAVFAVVFSRDGKKLATAGADFTVRVNSLEPSESDPITLFGHKDEVHALAFGPKGTLISGGYDQSILVHHLDSKDLLDIAWGRIRRTFDDRECDEYLQLASCPPEYAAFTDGVKLAETGKMNEAIKQFQLVKKNPVFLGTPEEIAQRFRANHLLESANLSGQAGDIGQALKEFAELKKIHFSKLKDALTELSKTAQVMLSRGQVEPLITIAQEGPKLEPSFDLPTDSWNDLCWFGSLWGNAPKVMFACNRAVGIGTNPEYHDSRGVALALTHRYEEAIEEFEGFLASPTMPEAEKVTRRHWVEQLKKGQNPFSLAARRQLLVESGVPLSELHNIH